MLKETQTACNHSPYLYRAVPGGLIDRESLRNNLAAIAESLWQLSESIRNHAIDLESMLPESAREEEGNHHE